MKYIEYYAFVWEYGFCIIRLLNGLWILAHYYTVLQTLFYYKCICIDFAHIYFE